MNDTDDELDMAAETVRCVQCDTDVDREDTLEQDDNGPVCLSCSAAPRCDVCGSQDITGASACHWDTPTGVKAIALSCSDPCGDIIESLRDAHGRLTPAAVRAAARN